MAILASSERLFAHCHLLIRSFDQFLIYICILSSVISPRIFTRFYFTFVFKPHAEYFLSPDDAVDWRKLGLLKDLNINFTVVKGFVWTFVSFNSARADSCSSNFHPSMQIRPCTAPKKPLSNSSSLFLTKIGAPVAFAPCPKFLTCRDSLTTCDHNLPRIPIYLKCDALIWCCFLKMDLDKVVSSVLNFIKSLSSPVQIIGLLIIVIIVRKIVQSRFKKPPPPPREKPLEPMRKRDFTPQELVEYDGLKQERVLLAVNGKVFDVTRGKDFYGPG